MLYLKVQAVPDSLKEKKERDSFQRGRRRKSRGEKKRNDSGGD